MVKTVIVIPLNILEIISGYPNTCAARIYIKVTPAIPIIIENKVTGNEPILLGSIFLS